MLIEPIKREHFEKFLKYIKVELLPYQWDLVDICLEMPEFMRIKQARQSGKSFIMALIASYLIYQRGYNIGVFAPNQHTTKHIMKHINKILTDIVKHKGAFDACRVFYISLKKGGSCVGLSVAPDAIIEGHTLHLALVDEMQDCDYDTVQDSVVPMLSWTNGCLWAVGIGGLINSFGERLNANKVFDCPWQQIIEHKEGYENKVKIAQDNMLPAHFSAHYECKTLDASGAYLIPVINEADNPRDHTQQPHHRVPTLYKEIVVGIDLGKRKDSSVLTIVGKYDDDEEKVEKLHIIDWQVLNGEYLTQIEDMKVFLNKYYYNSIICETNAPGDAVVELLRENFVGVRECFLTDMKKLKLCKEVSIAANNGRLTYQADRPLSRQFYNDITKLGVTYTTSDKMKVDHSDFLSSLLMSFVR